MPLNIVSPTPPDIVIAQSVQCRPIAEIAAKLGLEEDDYEPHGHQKAKVETCKPTLLTGRSLARCAHFPMNTQQSRRCAILRSRLRGLPCRLPPCAAASAQGRQPWLPPVKSKLQCAATYTFNLAGQTVCARQAGPCAQRQIHCGCGHHADPAGRGQEVRSACGKRGEAQAWPAACPLACLPACMPAVICPPIYPLFHALLHLPDLRS